MAKQGQPPAEGEALDQQQEERRLLVKELLEQQQRERDEIVRAFLTQQAQQQQVQPTQMPPQDVRRAIRDRLESMMPGQDGVPIQLLPSDGAVMLGRAGMIPDDDVNDLFRQYFRIGEHQVLHDDPFDPEQRWRASVDPKDVATLARPTATTVWSQDSIVLRGSRGVIAANVGAAELQRVFAGDLIWLFYWERLGTFRMLGTLLDDYATRGRYPLRSDDATTVYIETMVRLTKMGLASSVRERDSSYRRCLGWTSEAGRKLGTTSVTNTALNTQFHRFLELALTYYKEKRVINAIYDAVQKKAPNLATLESIMETIRLLKAAVLPFGYGRNHLHVVTGVAWLVAALDLVKRVRQDIGVPAGFIAPYQYVPAAMEVLLGNGNPAKAVSNRYTLHKQCAENGRAILLDVEALEDGGGGDADYTRPDVLSTWLDTLEPYVEAYRAAYKATTGSDIATPGAAIEQAA